MTDLAFPNTNVVFHDPRIFARELELIYGSSWLFVGTADEADPPDPVDGVIEHVGSLRFVNNGPAPRTSLRDYLGRAVAQVEEVSASAVTPLFEVRMDLEANWKLVVSGAIEDYHLPFVHGVSVTPWRTEPATPELAAHGHSWYSTPAVLGRTARLLHRGLAGSRPVPQEFANYLIYPNLLLVRLWGVVHITTFLPIAPNLTRRITRIYDHTPGRSPLDPRRWLRAAIAAAFKQGMSVTFREDQRIVAEAQKGTLAGRTLPRGPAHAEESRVEHFLAETARRLSVH